MSDLKGRLRGCATIHGQLRESIYLEAYNEIVRLEELLRPTEMVMVRAGRMIDGKFDIVTEVQIKFYKDTQRPVEFPIAFPRLTHQLGYVTHIGYKDKIIEVNPRISIASGCVGLDLRLLDLGRLEVGD